MGEKSNFFDVGMFIAFHNVVVHVCIVTALLVVNNGYSCSVDLPPRDVLQDVITDFIDRYDIGYIYQQQTSLQSSSHRKRKMVDYDRERASKCARSDWFSPLPRFDDKQFERTNMMVEERVRNEERESENFYDLGEEQSVMVTSEDDADSSKDSGDSSTDGSLVINTVGNFDMSDVRDSSVKYTIVQRRWNKLYSDETSLRLQDAVKKFVFKEHHGDDGSLDVNETDEDYDPLTY